MSGSKEKKKEKKEENEEEEKRKGRRGRKKRKGRRKEKRRRKRTNERKEGSLRSSGQGRSHCSAAAFLTGGSCGEDGALAAPTCRLPVLCSRSLSERSSIKKIGTSSSKRTRLYF